MRLFCLVVIFLKWGVIFEVLLPGFCSILLCCMDFDLGLHLFCIHQLCFYRLSILIMRFISIFLSQGFNCAEMKWIMLISLFFTTFDFIGFVGLCCVRASSFLLSPMFHLLPLYFKSSHLFPHATVSVNLSIFVTRSWFVVFIFPISIKAFPTFSHMLMYLWNCRFSLLPSDSLDLLNRY